MDYRRFIQLLGVSCFLSTASSFAEPTAEMCHEAAHITTIDAYKKTYTGPVPKTLIEGGTADEHVRAIVSHKFYRYGVIRDLTPWITLFSPDLEIIRAGHELQKRNATEILRFYEKTKSLEDILTQAASEGVTYSPKALEDADRKMHLLLKAPELFKRYRGLASKVCLAYPFLFCERMIQRIFDLMDTRSFGAAVSFPSIMKTIMTDARYRKPLAQLALKYLNFDSDRMRDASTGTLYIFEELKQAFVESGQAPDVAESMTWTIMGLYGARGASVSFQKFFFNRESYPVILSLHVLFSAMAVMDSLTLSDGRPFSYSANTFTKCAYGRPYHFWMGAYLAQELKKEGFPNHSIFMAVHLAGVGYEFAAPVFGKDPKVVFREPLESPRLNNLRKNIVFNDAGSLWGLTYKYPIPPPILVDLALDMTRLAARPIPDSVRKRHEEIWKADQTQAFFWWSQAVATDAHIPAWLLVLAAYPI